MGDPLYQVSNFQAKESKDIEQTTFDSSLTLTFIHVHWTSIVVIYSLKVSTVPSLATLPSDLNIYSKEASSVQRSETFQQRGKKILRGQYFFVDKKSDLDLCIVTLKSTRFIYSLRASSVPRLATFKQRGQKIFSKHRFVYWSTNLHVQNNMPPFLKRGTKMDFQ